MRRDNGGPGDGVPVEHPVEHHAGGVWGAAATVHGDEVVAENGVVSEAWVPSGGGKEVTVDEAPLREGAEAGAGRDERGIGSGGETVVGGCGRGGERFEGPESGGEPARVVELEDGSAGVLHLRRPATAGSRSCRR